MNGTVYIKKLIKTLDKEHFVLALLLFSYLLQGIASLIYQVSWEQATEVIVGMALPTMAIVVSLFFLGMALGAYIVRRLNLNFKYAGLAYGINALLLSFAGWLFVVSREWQFLCNLTADDAKWLLAIYSLRMSAVSLFLFLPAVLIGASFPLLLCSALIRKLANGPLALYFFNVSGSVIGAIAAGFFLLPRFGIVYCADSGSVLMFLSGLIVLLINKQAFESAKLVHKAPKQLAGLPSASKVNSRVLPLVVIISAGFFSMLLELLFVRLFALFMGSSGLAFALVVAMQLTAIAVGSFLVHCYKSSRTKDYYLRFSFLYMIAGVWLLAALLLFPHVAGFIGYVRNYLLMTAHFSANVAIFVAGSLALFLNMFVPSCCFGSILPLYFRLRSASKNLAPLSSASAYMANLFAAVIGTLAGGVFIIPFLNNISHYAIRLSFTISALAMLLVAVWLYFQSDIAKSYKHKNLVGVIATVFLTALIPGLSRWWQYPLINQNEQILFYKEGVNATVTLIKKPAQNILLLQTDGCAEGSVRANEACPAPNSDEQTQTLLGLLPSLLGCAKETFLLGLGNGVTTRALLTNIELQHLTIAELEPAVLEMKQQFMPLKDERMQVKISDGRQLLSLLDKKYNVIVSQAGEPWRSCSRHLYTLEFWRLVKSRLQTNGIFCQWLPLYGIDENNLYVLVHTFRQVFPHAIVFKPKRAGEVILLAFNNDFSAETIAATFDKEEITNGKLAALRKVLTDISSMASADWENWLKNNSGSDRKADELLNLDAYPIVQYKSQALVAEHGVRIFIDIDKMM